MASERTIPVIRMQMVSFDMIPAENQQLLQMARHDLSQMKNITKFRNALKGANGCHVARSDKEIALSYVFQEESKKPQVRARLFYDLVY